jgi:ribosomal-protein-alanine N-acetyltransferase
MIIIPFKDKENARIRELKKFDILSLETLAQDSEIQKNFFKLESAENYFPSAVAWNNEKPRDYWGFVIECNKPSESVQFPAGYIHLIRNYSENKAQVDFFIDKNYRNKHLASSAIKTISNFAFQDLHLDLLEAKIDPANEASKNVLQSNRFEFYDKSNYDLEKDGSTDAYEIYTLFRD